jgi:ATP-dependent protease ClpP protease subunit
MTRRIDNIIAHGLEKNPSFCLSGGVDDDMLKYCFLSLHSLGITKPITIFLNSTGGDLGVAWSICDLIRNLGSEVNIVVLGSACSAASVILQAGVRRFISENSFIMIYAGHFEEQPDLPVETRKNPEKVLMRTNSSAL